MERKQIVRKKREREKDVEKEDGREKTGERKDSSLEYGERKKESLGLKVQGNVWRERRQGERIWERRRAKKT